MDSLDAYPKTWPSRDELITILGERIPLVPLLKESGELQDHPSCWAESVSVTSSSCWLVTLMRKTLSPQGDTLKR